MDLQAILDAPSSDEDDDDYLQRYASTYAGNGNNGNGGADISLSATVSNLSNVSSIKDRSLSGGAGIGGRGRSGGGFGATASSGIGNGISYNDVGRETRQPQTQYYHRHDQQHHHHHHHHQEQMEILSGVSTSPGKPSFRKMMAKMDGDGIGDSILNDLKGEDDDIVGQILRSYAGNSSKCGTDTAANLELERILREADANDDDDEDDEGETDHHLDHRYRKMSPSRKSNHGTGAGATTSTSNYNHATITNKHTDTLLQSILNEADDDDDEDSEIENHDALSPNSGSYYNTKQQQQQQQQFNHQLDSFSGLSLSGRSTGGGSSSYAGMRRLSSITPPTAPPSSSHAMEVDAILNSVRDDDDDDDDDDDSDGLNLDMRNYAKQQQPQLSYRNNIISSATMDDSDDDTDENGTDIGLNFNFSTGSVSNGKNRPLQDAKYDDNISMQYPLTRKESSQPQHEQKEIYIHGDSRSEVSVDQLFSLKDYTANFLHGKHSRQEDDNGGGNSSSNIRHEGLASPARIAHGNRSSNAGADDDQQSDDHLSDLCLQQAEAYERRLLKPITRNVVSPLTVKRRMKPKVELMTKSRMSSKSTTTSQSLASSQQQHPSSQQSNQNPRFGFSGGIIQSKSMTTLGAQLLKSNNDSSRNTHSTVGGLPTSLAVNSKFIAVGNQRGQVWVFDLFEQLKIILDESSMAAGNTSARADANATAKSGSVTSIDLSLHGDFLLAGYGSGHVILWDIIKGSILKKIVDLHSSSISSARFTSVPMAGAGSSDNTVGAVSVDASGLVNKLVFTRGRLWSTQYSVETECLLDGTAGQILAMDALPALDLAQATSERGQEVYYHPSVHKIVLIALSSGRSSFAVSVEPKVSVLHRWARPSTERIDPTICEEDRMTDVSGASTYVSSYAASYASSYVSTSKYHTSSAAAKPPKPSDKPADPNSIAVPYLPCLSWGWALVSGGGHSVTPILARAWGCCLQFLRASFPPMDEFEAANNVDDGTIHWPAFGTHDEFDASAPVVALNWLGKRSLVYLTLTNEFTIIDTVIMTMQERLDFSGMKLVYAEFALSRFSKQLPGSSGCTTFMNSIRSSDNRLLVLCQEEIKEITVLGMRRQIMSLEDQGQWLEALALALDHYESTIKSQEDNQRDLSGAPQIESMTSSDPSLLTEDEIWMAEMAMRYLILAIDNAPDSSPAEFSFSNSKLPGRLNLAESHFEMLSGVCMEFCIVTRRLDLLFGHIFRCFYEARYINVFLDVMEAYVLNDKLKYIAPEAMVLFVAHCKDMKELSTVERCLLHMDCNLMDFDSILSLLKKNELYTGLFHVYSNGLDDYISPLEILFEAVFDAADAAEDICVDRRKDGLPSNKFEQYGYKAMLYLRYCFSGKAFPKGDDILPEERIRTLHPELFDLILREIIINSPQQRHPTQPQSRNKSFRGIRALSYPYLRALLLTDTKAFLDCLAIVLDDPEARFMEASSSPMVQALSYEVEFETDDGNMAKERFSGILPKEDESIDPQLLPDRQHLVNILSSIIMSDKGLVDSMYHFGSRKKITLLSIKSKHFFLDFLAKYLKLGTITAPKYLTGEVFVRACNKKGASEDDILSLLHALPRSSYELDEILYTVERVDMTRGALFLHKAGVTMSIDREGMLEKCQKHFNCSIDCYLKDDDEDFKKGVFAYIQKECTGRNESMLRNAVLERLPELVKLDAIHTAHLVGEIFVEEIDTILSSLQGIESGRVEYSFLHAIISGDLDRVDPVVAQELSANLTVNHHHSYLLLMTKFQPGIVYHYLSTNRNYHLNNALKLCQERKITDASAYLLERMGDVSGALKLMLETLDTRMITLKDILQQNGSTPSRKNSRAADLKSGLHQNDAAGKEIGRIKQILSAVLDLCERNKNDHFTLDNERAGPLLWFHVLDRLVNAKSLLRISKESITMEHPTSVAISTVLSDLLLMTMQRMISNVSLFELMHKITQDHAGSDLGEFREMLVSMLKTYSSELDVCSSAVDVMYHDIRRMSYEKKRLKVRASFVHECPKQFSKDSILAVGPDGSCDVTSHHRVHGNGHLLSTNEQASAANSALSLLQQRRRNGRHQGHRPGKRSRQGGNTINLMTASEYQRVDAQDIFGTSARQVGGLSEAQHVGGLL